MTRLPFSPGAALVLASAAGLDLVIGEPPNRYHPVAHAGQLLDRIIRRLPVEPAAPALLAGGGLLAGGVLGAATAGTLAERISSLLGPLSFLPKAVALKSTLSIRALDEAVAQVERAMAGGDIASARDGLRALVSRPTEKLDASQICSAAIESAAENLTDSIIAPMLAYAVGGIPGAAAYRVVNTLDAMIGYHGQYEYLGKASARLDDLLNLIPARLAGLAIVAVAPLAGGSSGDALRTMRRDASLTESPNAGWPMAAMAGALGVWLEKPGHYRLNPTGRAPVAADIARARRVLRAASLAGLAVAMVISRWHRAA